MKWNIIADSSIDLFELKAAYENIEFSTVPFSIDVDEKEYLDDRSLDIGALLSTMKACKTASRTACPSTGAWYK